MATCCPIKQWAYTNPLARKTLKWERPSHLLQIRYGHTRLGIDLDREMQKLWRRLYLPQFWQNWRSWLGFTTIYNFWHPLVVWEHISHIFGETTVFTIARHGSSLTSIDRRMKKMWSINTMEYYLALRKKDILSFVLTWMNLEDIMVNEIRQSQKNKHYMIPLI